MDDQKLFDTMCETLYSAVISDTLDQLGVLQTSDA